MIVVRPAFAFDSYTLIRTGQNTKSALFIKESQIFYSPAINNFNTYPTSNFSNLQLQPAIYQGGNPKYEFKSINTCEDDDRLVIAVGDRGQIYISERMENGGYAYPKIWHKVNTPSTYGNYFFTSSACHVDKTTNIATIAITGQKTDKFTDNINSNNQQRPVLIMAEFNTTNSNLAITFQDKTSLFPTINLSHWMTLLKVVYGQDNFVAVGQNFLVTIPAMIEAMPRSSLLISGDSAHDVNMFTVAFANSSDTAHQDLFVAFGDSKICQIHGTTKTHNCSPISRSDLLPSVNTGYGGFTTPDGIISSACINSNNTAVCTLLFYQHDTEHNHYKLVRYEPVANSFGAIFNNISLDNDNGLATDIMPTVLARPDLLSTDYFYEKNYINYRTYTGEGAMQPIKKLVVGIKFP